MKKLLVLTIALIAFGASLAYAQGTSRLTYANCNIAGNTDRTYPCNVDPPQTPLISSFQLATGLPDFVGVDAFIDLALASPAVPDWWRTAPGECREGLAAAVGITLLSGCTNPYAGTAGQGGGLDPNQNDPSARPNHRQLHIAWARAEAGATNNTSQYAGARLNIDGTGADVCAGCAQPANLCLTLLKVYGQGGTGQGGTILNMQPGPNSCVTWAGGITASQSKTWGQVKSLYR
jgi:hypothetical protein